MIRLGGCFRFAALALAIVALLPSSARAQDGGVGVGALAGIVRPTLTSEGLNDFFSTRTGTMFGLWVGGNRNGAVGFTGEFIYLIRKADAGNDELEFPGLEIPAVVHVNFGSRDRNKAMGYALVGPVFTLNLKQKLNGVDVSDNFNGADIGLMVGGGFEIVRIAAEVRGNWGFRNISDEGTFTDTKTRSIEFLVKVRFN
jgi:Outer membrane protein beta-barrel domain